MPPQYVPANICPGDLFGKLDSGCSGRPDRTSDICKARRDTSLDIRPWYSRSDRQNRLSSKFYLQLAENHTTFWVLEE